MDWQYHKICRVINCTICDVSSADWLRHNHSYLSVWSCNAGRNISGEMYKTLHTENGLKKTEIEIGWKKNPGLVRLKNESD